MFLVINEFAAFFVGLFFNSALLYLIHRRTPSLMRSYAVILRIHAISDLLFDITNFVTSTHCLSIGGRFFFLNGGPHSHYWSSTYIYYSVLAYLWIVVYAPLGLVPLDFYYRLRAICHGDLISNRRIGLIAAFAYFFSFIVAFPINSLYMKAGPLPGTDRYDIMVQNALNVSRENLPAYLTMGIYGLLETGVLVMVILIVFIDYTFIAYVIYQMNQKMRENAKRNVSKKAEETQRQVTRIMFIQAMIPLFLCVPTTINICSGFFLIDTTKFGPIVFAIISWLAALKPIATIFIVPHYRSSLFRIGNLSSSDSPTAYEISQKSNSIFRPKSSVAQAAPVVTINNNNPNSIVFFPNY